MDNVLALSDEAVFVGELASGMDSPIQCGWIYGRAIDLDGLRRFHHNLGRALLLSRRIQRSALPFARSRWVASNGSPDIEIAPSARPRAEFDTWLREQADKPVDAEQGPGWRLGVLPFQDGGTGVGLLASHSLIDGVGLCQALVDAVQGTTTSVDWPAAGRLRTLWADARQSVRDLPKVGRALKTAARQIRRARSERAGSAPTETISPNTEHDEQVTAPEVAVFVDLAQWDARARSLGGTSNSLLVGFAAKLAEQLGRRRPGDGAVMVSVPVNQRTDGDTRGYANVQVGVTVDPTTAAADLGPIRNSTKQALIDQVLSDRYAVLPLIPLLPLWLAKRMAWPTDSSAKVTASNLGDVDPAANRPDGTDADYLSIRWTCSRVASNIVDRIGGVLTLLSGRINGRIFICVYSYQPGQPNTTDHLRSVISHALADFSLSGTFQSDVSHSGGGN